MHPGTGRAIHIWRAASGQHLPKVPEQTGGFGKMVPEALGREVSQCLPGSGWSWTRAADDWKTQVWYPGHEQLKKRYPDIVFHLAGRTLVIWLPWRRRTMTVYLLAVYGQPETLARCWCWCYYDGTLLHRDRPGAVGSIFEEGLTTHWSAWDKTERRLCLWSPHTGSQTPSAGEPQGTFCFMSSAHFPSCGPGESRFWEAVGSLTGQLPNLKRGSR